MTKAQRTQHEQDQALFADILIMNERAKERGLRLLSVAQIKRKRKKLLGY